MATLKEQEELIKLLKKEEELRVKIERLKGEAISKLEEEAVLMRVQAEEQAKLIEILELDQTTRNKLLMQEKMIVDDLESKGRISTQIAEQKRKSIIEAISLQGQALEDAKKELQTKKASLDQQLKSNAAIRDGAEAAGQMADSFARAVGFGPGLTKNILDAVGAGGTFGEIFEKAGKSLKKNFSGSGVLAFAITNTAQLLKSFDEITARLAASTGQGRTFAGVVEESFSNTSDFATSLEDTADAVDGLFSSFVRFNNLSEASKTSLTESATLMERLGVDIQETGERLNYLTVALGMSVPEADKFNQSLIRLAIGLGMAPGALTSQFNQLIPKLSLFSDGGVKAFEQTAIAARQLGLDLKTGVLDLFNLTEGLQDFESAADKVASINVVLGGSFVNAFDLVMGAAEGPVAQVKQLQDAFQQAGKNMDDMGFYERKFLADSLGVSFDNLTKIINGQINTEEDLKTTEEQMRDAMKDTATMMRQMNAAIESLSASLSPLLQALTPIIQMFATFIKFGGDSFLLMATLGVGAMMLASKIAVLNMTAGATVGIFGVAFAGFAAGYLAIKKFGDYLTGPGMAALAVLSAMAGLMLMTTVAGAPLGFALLGLAAALGLGAAGVISSGPAGEPAASDSPIGSSIGSFADFKMGSSVNDAIIQQGKITPIASQDQAMTVLARPGGAIDLTAEKSQKQLASGTDLTPQMAKMTDTMNKFVAAANKVMTRDQPPVEVALNLDGRKLTKTVISNINKDFSLTNEARMPSEGLG